jgi:LPS-assembly protein
VPAPGASNAFNQIHAGVTYGAETKPGLSAGAMTGYDLVHEQLQYGAIEAGYNWNCCGIALEMRRFSLTNIRDDTEYTYRFSLAGFGSIINIPRAVRLF